jgi:hypothetical protein
MVMDQYEERRLATQAKADPYAREIEDDEVRRQRDLNGHVLIKSSERPFDLTRQGRLAFYLGGEETDTPLLNRSFFRHDIRTQSGRHTHQGGLVIFVMEGNGYSTVNGVAVDWKQYDVILLPMIPELCEHQHFNKEPGKPAVWCAFIYESLSREYGNDVKQNTDTPELVK